MLRRWKLFGQSQQSEALPTGDCFYRSPGEICIGQGPYYGLREMVQSLYSSLAYSATAATSSSSPSSSVSVLI